MDNNKRKLRRNDVRSQEDAVGPESLGRARRSCAQRGLAVRDTGAHLHGYAEQHGSRKIHGGKSTSWREVVAKSEEERKPSPKRRRRRRTETILAQPVPSSCSLEQKKQEQTRDVSTNKMVDEMRAMHKQQMQGAFDIQNNSDEGSIADECFTSESDEFERLPTSKAVARGSKEAEPKFEEYLEEPESEDLLDDSRRKVVVKRERHHEEEHRRSSRHTRGNEPTRGSRKRMSSAPATVSWRKESPRRKRGRNEKQRSPSRKPRAERQEGPLWRAYRKR